MTLTLVMAIRLLVSSSCLWRRYSVIINILDNKINKLITIKVNDNKINILYMFTD